MFINKFLWFLYYTILIIFVINITYIYQNNILDKYFGINGLKETSDFINKSFEEPDNKYFKYRLTNYTKPAIPKFETNYDDFKDNPIIPKDITGNLIIIMDYFMSDDSTHGSEVSENFNKNVELKENDGILYLNTSSYNHNIVQNLNLKKNKYKKYYYRYTIRDLNHNFQNEMDTRLYNYKDYIMKIKELNPKANIIISQSFSNLSFIDKNIELIKEGIKLGYAQPYLHKIFNGKYEYNLKEKIDYLKFNINCTLMKEAYIVLDIKDYLTEKILSDKEKVIKVCLKDDYKPYFSENYKCVDDDNTSLPTPIVTYNYFKK